MKGLEKYLTDEPNTREQNFKSPDEIHEDSINDLGNEISLINEININISKLDDNDVEGHIWWNKFLDLAWKYREELPF